MTKISPDEIYLILDINKISIQDSIILEQVDLVSIGNNILGKEITLSKKCAQAWMQMKDDALKDSIQISLKSSRSRCKLSLDSRRTVPVKKEGIISIKQSKKYLELIHLKGYNFFSAYRNKLGWGIGIVKK